MLAFAKLDDETIAALRRVPPLPIDHDFGIRRLHADRDAPKIIRLRAVATAAMTVLAASARADSDAAGRIGGRLLPGAGRGSCASPAGSGSITELSFSGPPA